MKKLFLSLCLAYAILVTYSQINVTTGNSIGIGIGETTPTSKLSIHGQGNSYASTYMENIVSGNSSRSLQTFNSTATGTWGFSVLSRIEVKPGAASYLVGIKSLAYDTDTYPSASRTYGVMGVGGNGAAGYNYGVYGQLYGSKNGAAIFASTPGRYDINVGGVWAGYFRGDVKIEDDLYVDAVHTASDMQLKKDVRLIKNEMASQVDALSQLNAIKYKLKTPLELNLIEASVLDTTSLDYAQMFAAEDKYIEDKIGLSAQEVQEVFPEIVKQDSQGFLSVNYQELIPILIEAIKEQDAEMDALKEEIMVLRELIKKQ